MKEILATIWKKHEDNMESMGGDGNAGTCSLVYLFSSMIV